MVFEINEEDRSTIKEIINKKNLIDVEMLELISLYVWLRKGVRVELNRPHNPIQLQLMSQAYDKACEWLFENKYNE